MSSDMATIMLGTIEEECCSASLATITIDGNHECPRLHPLNRKSLTTIIRRDRRLSDDTRRIQKAGQRWLPP